MKHIIKIVFVFTALMSGAAFSCSAQTLCKCKIPIDNSFQIVPMTNARIDTDIGVPPLYENDNATSQAIQLPFNFCFYGQSYDSLFISNNGIISFINPIYNFIDSGTNIPFGADTIIISPFWADANTVGNAGLVYYKVTPTYMVVIWDSVRFAGIDVDGWNTFQLTITDGQDPILPAGNNVKYCYPIMQWACSESSGGFSGYGGTPAVVGINKGDGVNYALISALSKPGDFYYGPFSAYNGVDWLDFQSFTFNTCFSGNTMAPVIANYEPLYAKMFICPCDTAATEIALGAPDSVVAQNCDTVTITAAFICAEPGQSAVLSYSVQGSLNIYSVYTSIDSTMDSIIIQLIPTFTDSGSQTLTITATDTVANVSSSISYNIVVTTHCADSSIIIPSGITSPKTGSGFSVYPNPANNHFIIKFDNAASAIAKIYDVIGRETLSAKLNLGINDVDVSGLPKGMYFVRLFKDSEPLGVQKIILQ